jgi:hypothetical protein
MSMTLDDLLRRELGIWPVHTLNAERAMIRLTKVMGDLAAIVRDAQERDRFDTHEFATELGNLIGTAVRSIDCVGEDVELAVGRALDRQRQYVAHRKLRGIVP